MRKENDCQPRQAPPLRQTAQAVTVDWMRRRLNYPRTVSEELDLPYQTSSDPYHDCTEMGRRSAMRSRPCIRGFAAAEARIDRTGSRRHSQSVIPSAR